MMSDSPPVSIVNTVMVIVRELVDGHFNELETWSNGIRLTAEEMEEAIKQYGEPLTIPPSSSFEEIDAILVRGSDPKRWSIRFDLWTEHDGKPDKSDLSLELTLIEGENDQPIRIEVDDLHVL